MTERCSHRGVLLAVVVLLAIVAMPVVVWASDHIVNIPALAFLPADPTVTYQRNANDTGNLSEASGSFYAAVPFSHFGRNVCEFTMYAQDNDADGTVSARLMKKGAAPNSTFTPATEMAAVTSTGGEIPLRAFTTFTINSPSVSGGFFYFVELTLTPGALIDVRGVRIVYRPSCGVG